MTPGDRPDRIEIRALRVVGTHGLLPEEQGRGQPFEIDLDVKADLRSAGGSDDLEDTVDYGQVVERAAAIVAGPSYRLLEALAEGIAAAVLADTRVTSVIVGVRKLRPPLAADLGSVGVRITRSRP
ncbi:MAG TPA: dihydroneopterin aldolase [Acidimicrobiales bacterium]|nr:dihydroneopterin aldolase [Acidimicrobiales bacterium]